MNALRLLPLALGLASSPATAQLASFERLGDLPGGPVNSNALGVSPDGFVAVGSGQSDTAYEAFRWEDGTMTPLGLPAGGVQSASARAASVDGSVLVGDRRSGNAYQAIRWENGVAELLGVPAGSSQSRAYDVTPDGAVVVGTGGDGGDSPPSAAFRWTVAGMQRLPDLPGGADHCRAHAVSSDGRVVVGWGTAGTERTAMRWIDGVPQALDLPEGFYQSAAHDVSADGRVIVGTAHVVGEPFEKAFIWTEDGGMLEIPDLPGGYPIAEAFAISGDGRVVTGRSDSGQTLIEAFVWTAEAGTRSLKRILEDEHGIDLTGWQIMATIGQSLSHDGRTIVGFGYNPEGQFEAWRVVLPPIPVAADPGADATEFALQVAPNPARRGVGVRLAQPAAGPVRIVVYDVLGRVAAVLHDAVLPAGAHRLELDIARLTPGVYIVRAAWREIVAERRLTVVR